MSNELNQSTRRVFLKQSGAVAGATMLASSLAPPVHAAQDNTIQVALVGCGGRGTGAARNALEVAGRGPIKLVAMADVFKDRLDSRHRSLKRLEHLADQVAVPEDQKFLGFDLLT